MTAELPLSRHVVERVVARSLMELAGVRGLLAPVRARPGVVIIGGQRCGTTSMYSYLSQHPSFARSLRKEVHYFDTFYGRGPRWYAGHFPASLRRGQMTGEASPYYLLHPHAPRRAAADLPGQTIFIAMLRNPVSRAYSHHTHVTRKGFETLGFEAALEAESSRTDEAWERLVADPGADHPAIQHFSYLRRGDYLPQLQRWTEVVGRDRLRVIDADDFFADPDGNYSRVLEWLGLPPRSLGVYETHNTYLRGPMRATTRLWLQDHFAPRNAALAEWLGEAAPKWARS